MSSLDLINRPWQARKLEGTTLLPGGLDSLNRLKRRELCKTGRNALGERYRRAARRGAQVQHWNNCSEGHKGLFPIPVTKQTKPWQVTGSESCPQTNCWVWSQYGWASAYWQLRSLWKAQVVVNLKELGDPKTGFCTRWSSALVLSPPVALPPSALLLHGKPAASPTKRCFSWLSFETIGAATRLEWLYSPSAWPQRNKDCGTGNRVVDNIIAEDRSL